MHKIIKTMMTLLKIKKVSTLIILVTSFMTLTIGAVTVYATQVGNFVVSIEPTPDMQLVLSENEDFLDKTGRLNAVGLTNMTNITYSSINIDSVVEGNGNTNHTNRYLAYNFYMKNLSEMVINYKITIEIDKVYKGVDAAMRVMVITNKKESKIYAKSQQIGNDSGMPEIVPEDVTNFKAPTKVMDELVTYFRNEEVVKYTVIIWLEGEDPQCTDEILSGSIKMSMRFKAV